VSRLTEVFCILKVKFKLMLCTKITIKDLDFEQKRTKGYLMGSARQVCHVLLRELSFVFRNSLD